MKDELYIVCDTVFPSGLPDIGLAEKALRRVLSHWVELSPSGKTSVSADGTVTETEPPKLAKRVFHVLLRPDPDTRLARVLKNTVGVYRDANALERVYAQLAPTHRYI